MAEKCMCSCFSFNEIHCTPNLKVRRYNIIWSIGKLSFFGKKCGGFIDSEKFYTQNANFEPNNKQVWHLRIYPCNSHASGVSNSNQASISKPCLNGYVSVCLVSLNNYKVVSHCKFSLLSEKQDEFNVVLADKIFRENNDTLQLSKFISRKILEETLGLIHKDNIKLQCNLEIFDERNCLSYSQCELCKLSEDFKNLLTNPKMFDVCISVNGKTFKAHKIILAARSDVFDSMFKHNMKESITNEIEITDTSPEVMEQILHYIYSGKCPELDSMALEIAKVADKYNLSDLKLACEESLCKILSVENAASILIVSDMLGMDKLKDQALRFINMHGSEVLSKENWESVSKYPHLVYEAYKKIFVEDTILH